MKRDVLRIGCGAGYAGDRIEPAVDLAERGALDVLVFECLAERTIALAQLQRLQDPQGGFDPLLRERMRAVLPACAARGTTIVSNMGAANPRAAARAVLDVAHELGLPRVKVAVVEGDDVLDWVRTHEPARLDAGEPVLALGDRLISANAYLGADAVLPALATGADVVITGRVADPALFLAPLMHAFGWAGADWPRLGQGICIGHLLECAAQVSGGYLADPGACDVPGLAEVGFPLAEVGADGAAVVTKLPGTGGRVDRLTCTAQLLYEIEDPAAYLQPDVVADFARVTLREAGLDRVEVRGATGRARPSTLKATLGVHDGFVGEGQISYAGPGARARGELALQLLQQRLERIGLGGHERRAELIGVDAMHGPASGRGHEPYEVRLRLAVRCGNRAQAQRVGREVEALYLNGPAAGGGVTQSVREVIAAVSVLVPRAAVQPRCEVFGT
jgi:hypothetical protein